MDTLKTISLKNFQSFVDSEIDLDPHFNLIVGASNLGKSAALRALKALVKNAQSTGLVRQGTKEFKVGVEFADGTVETLTKGAKKSIYEIHSDGKVFSHAKAGASSVPEEIADLWKLPDIAFASQHDAPFLLAEPASAVAKVLGDLTNASMLMEAVQLANKRRTAALTDAKARQREAEEARDELLTHAGLSVRQKALTVARETHRAASEVATQCQGLENLIRDFIKFRNLLTETEKSIKKSKGVDDLLSYAEKTVDTLQRLERLVEHREIAEQRLTSSVEAVTNSTIAQSEIETRIHDLISDNGICPLCNQAVV